MGQLIKLNADRSKLHALPAPIWALRWRIQTCSGLVINSSWLPETRYPSIQKTMFEFAGQIDMLYIDGKHLHEKNVTQTFVECPGWALASLTYKAMVSAVSGRNSVVGIEVQDIDGQIYLVGRDGTIHTEERKAAK